MKHVPPPTGMPVAGPELTQDSLAARLATQQRQRERALRRLRKLRVKARNEIDRLLEFLDASDIDPDLEDTGDAEEGADAEPSLGSFDRMTDQSKSWQTVDRNPDLYGWAGGVDNELDDADHEPALGSLDGQGDQTAWAAGGGRDLEQDPADSGIADLDGLLEQIGAPDWQGPRGGMV